MPRSILLVALAIAGLPALTGCGPSHRESAMFKEMRAGPGEPTFAEAYDPSLRLPMGMAQFQERLKKLGLQYNIVGGPDPASSMPLPSTNSGVDRGDLAQCIQIYGKRNAAERSMQAFRAYVNKQGQVFYIENAFAYTGP